VGAGSFQAVSAGGAEFEYSLGPVECAIGHLDLLAMQVGDDAGGQMDNWSMRRKDSPGCEHAGTPVEQGLEERIGPDCGQWAHWLMVVIVIARPDIVAAPGRELILLPKLAGISVLRAAVGAPGESSRHRLPGP